MAFSSGALYSQCFHHIEAKNWLQGKSIDWFLYDRNIVSSWACHFFLEIYCLDFQNISILEKTPYLDTFYTVSILSNAARLVKSIYYNYKIYLQKEFSITGYIEGNRTCIIYFIYTIQKHVKEIAIVVQQNLKFAVDFRKPLSNFVKLQVQLFLFFYAIAVFFYIFWKKKKKIPLNPLYYFIEKWMSLISASKSIWKWLKIAKTNWLLKNVRPTRSTG